MDEEARQKSFFGDRADDETWQECFYSLHEEDGLACFFWESVDEEAGQKYCCSLRKEAHQ